MRICEYCDAGDPTNIEPYHRPEDCPVKPEEDAPPVLKTLADFKRAMRPGIRLHTINHNTGRDMGIREVSRTNSQHFALKTEKHDGTWEHSYCRWPKAADCQISADAVVILSPSTRTPVLTYTFVSQEEKPVSVRPQIIVILEGGQVSQILADANDREIMVLDYDIQDEPDNDTVFAITQETGKDQPACVYYADVEVNPAAISRIQKETTIR